MERHKGMKRNLLEIENLFQIYANRVFDIGQGRAVYALTQEGVIGS